MTLEQEVLSIARDATHGAVTKAVVESLTGYQGPLRKLCEAVISENYDSLAKLIREEFAGLVGSDDFRSDLKIALNKKLASTLIARMGGELEAQVNKLKADPATRARITLAIEQAVKSA